MTHPPFYGKPGPEQILGGENHNQPWTRITFVGGSVLVVHWDGRYSVSGLGGDPVIIVYCPQGRRLHFPLHSIGMMEHQERLEDV